MLPSFFLQKISIGDLLELKPQGCVSLSLTQPSASQVSASTSPDRADEEEKMIKNIKNIP